MYTIIFKKILGETGIYKRLFELRRVMAMA